MTIGNGHNILHRAIGGVVEDSRMNESQSAEDTAAPVAPNVINALLPSGGGLSMGVVSNVKMNNHNMLHQWNLCHHGAHNLEHWVALVQQLVHYTFLHLTQLPWINRRQQGAHR